MSTFWLILTTIAFILCFIAYFYYLFSFWCLWRFFKQGREEKPICCPEPVSILKPVKSLSAFQIENISSFCVQDYPEYEIIIGTSSSEKEEIQAPYDILKCPLKVAYNTQDSGPNYKVGNLIAAASIARYNLFVLSDVDIWVPPDYLSNAVSCLVEEEADIVTSLYRVVNINGLCAAFQALEVQSDFIPNVLVAERIGKINFAFGSSIVIHRNLLENIGGLESLLPYLADDYQIGYKAADQGCRVAIARKIVDHRVNIKNWKDLWCQQLRWSITYRVCRPVGYFFSFLTHGISLALFNALCNGFSLASLLVLLLMIVVRYSTIFFANKRWINNNEIRKYIWFVPVKDLFSTALWAASFLTNRVFWAGKYFIVNRDGTFTEKV